MLVILGLSTALAATPGYYLPDDVATKSKVFASTSAEMMPRFESAQTTISSLNKALNELELGVALSGKSAPEGQPDWAQTTRRALTVQSIKLQRFLNLLQTDYSNVFSEALTRSLPSLSGTYTLSECGNTGVMAQFKKTNCEGEDLNDDLAALIDQDAKLQAELAEIHGLVWPEIVVEKKTWGVIPLTGSKQYIQLSSLAAKYFGTQLANHEASLVAALDPLTEKLESKDAEAIKQAGVLKDQWREGLGTSGVAWQAAIKDGLTRAGLGEVGLCGNPGYLGGCEGEDVTDKAIEALGADKKFLKATSKVK